VSVPFVLLPYQQAWVADPSAVKICEKSRRVGLSWAEASDDALTAAASRDAGGSEALFGSLAKSGGYRPSDSACMGTGQIAQGRGSGFCCQTKSSASSEKVRSQSQSI